MRDFCSRGDARHLRVLLDGAAKDVEVHNFYVPAGGDEPDPEVNPKFAHKLAFVDEMAEWAAVDKAAAGRAILVGDLNIAPLKHDVWSHRALLNVVSHTPVEVEKLKRAQAADPWVDALRKFVPDDQKLPLARLVQHEQGAAPRPCPGEPRARAGAEIDGGPARSPRLGAPFRPRPGQGDLLPVACLADDHRVISIRAVSPFGPISQQTCAIAQKCYIMV